MSKYINEWMIEHIASFSSIYVLNNYQKTNRRVCKYLPHNCTSLRLLTSTIFSNFVDVPSNTLNVYFLGSYQNEVKGNARFKIIKTIEKTDIFQSTSEFIRLKNFSCYDNLILTLIVEFNGTFKYFKTCVNMCSLFSNSQNYLKVTKYYDLEYLYFYEYNFLQDDLFMKQSGEKIAVEYKIYTLKPENTHHYNFSEQEYEEKNEKKEILRFMDKDILFDYLKCILCFRKFVNKVELNNHLLYYHLGFRLKDPKEPIVHIISTKNDQVIDNRINNFRLFKSNMCKEFCYINMCLQRCGIVQKKRMKKIYYRPEVMETDDVKVYGSNFIAIVNDRRLNELVDIDKSKLDFMRRWNLFILNMKIRPDIEKIPELVLNFLINEKNKSESFLFLLTLYENCTLSQQQISNILFQLVNR
ncbi:hypothetical protein EDEG_00545 [Edhazardia aedis USNM 41457]|uniref:C2H2-type domain-containing protein n=1 Tax=Edhazardia aedis (strain USNM 41457) TaxID=1003232 RepID=J9DF64_EDHAE|nr:hypothetical protein EDEG_00545 [Edhazardia aedis USNM 41457]|eukprot:EJW01245.1 hypothetical protein EDEG_00545 [Edhazardia aedis USNM 41457]